MRAILKSSAAFRILPAIILVAVGGSLSRGFPWLGEWNWTTDWLAGASLLLAPLVAACSAFDVTRTYRGLSQLFSSTPRSHWWLVTCWLSNALIGIAVQCTVVVVGLVANAVVGAGGVPGFGSMPAVLTLFGGASAIGLLIGVLIRSMLAVPLAVVAIFGATQLSTSGTLQNVFREGGVTGSMVGLAWDGSIIAATSTFYIAAAIFCSAVGFAVVRQQKSRRMVFSAIFAVAVAALSYGYLEFRGDDRLTENSTAQEYECVGREPQVCMAQETTRSLGSLASEIEQGADALRRVGVVPPTRFVQVVPGEDLPMGAAPMFVESISMNQDRASVGDALRYLATPAYCREVIASDTAPPEVYFESKFLLQNWIAKQIGALDPSSLPSGEARSWLSLPIGDQAGWIQSTYQHMERCNLEDVRLPY